MRKLIRKIHLWLGLVSGLVLSVVGITGSIYVFEPEISKLITKEYHTQKETILFSNEIEIASEIEKQTGKKIESLQWPQRGRETYVFKLFDDKGWHYFDQSTGKIVYGDELFGNSFFSFILDFHTSLTLGEIGRYITGTSSLIFALFILSTGVYLWWPRVKGRIKSSFKIKWNASKKRFNYDLHNVTGFYFFIPLFLLGITGAYFTFPTQFQKVVDVLSFSKSKSESIWDKSYTYDYSMKMLTIQEALSFMNEHYSDHYKRNLWMTSDKKGALTFSYQKHNTVHTGTDSRIFLRINPYTGTVLDEQNYLKLSRGETITNWAMPIHYGEFGGLITRILWFFAGLIPALLTWTGVKIWLGKKKRKNSKHITKATLADTNT